MSKLNGTNAGPLPRGTVSPGALYELLKSPIYIGGLDDQGSVDTGQYGAILPTEVGGERTDSAVGRGD